MHTSSEKSQEQFFQDLAIQWPELMQKSQIQYIEIGLGWFNLIDTLCSLICRDLDNAKRRLKYAMEYPANNPNVTIADLEKEVEEELENLPIIVQIKEKFGGLRFYVDNASDRIYNFIDFAETLSNTTCEICGSPGGHSGGFWIKTLCKKHAEKEASP